MIESLVGRDLVNFTRKVEAWWIFEAGPRLVVIGGISAHVYYFPSGQKTVVSFTIDAADGDQFECLGIKEKRHSWEGPWLFTCLSDLNQF